MGVSQEMVELGVKGWKEHAPLSYRFLNEYGQTFIDGKDVPALNNQQCYMNAYQMMLSNVNLSYAEGLACKPDLIPLAHAWCVDKESGIVVDPTWGKAGADYFGVTFKETFVLKTALKTEVYGILDSLYLLKQSAEDVYKYLVSGVTNESGRV